MKALLLGFRWQVAPGNSFIASIGLHSRTESFTVYNALISDSYGDTTTLNSSLELSKALHVVAGAEFSFSDDLRLHIEGYYQHLFNIPIVNKRTSQYSTLNSAERLADAALDNAGTGKNSGVEVTIEKSFTKN